MYTMDDDLVTRQTLTFAGTPAQFGNLARQFMEDHNDFACFVTEPKIQPWLRGRDAQQVPPIAPKVRIKFFGEFPAPPSAIRNRDHEVGIEQPAIPETVRLDVHEDGDFGAPLRSPEGFIVAELMGNGKSLIAVMAIDADWPGVRGKWESFVAHLRRLQYLEPRQPQPDSTTFHVKIDTAYGPIIGTPGHVDQHFDLAATSSATGWQSKLDTRLASIEAQIGAGFAAMQQNFDDVKGGIRVIYGHLTDDTRAQLERIMADVHAGLLEQGEMSQTLDAVRRALRYMQRHQNVVAPEIRAALPSLDAAVQSHLSLGQKLELTLPVIPGFLAYKVELAAGSDADLNVVLTELTQRWDALTASRPR